MPAGRPSLGITKKVSLTLTPEEWSEIESSGLTVAAFLKERMKVIPEIKKETEDIPHLGVDTTVIDRNPVHYPRRYIEERWDIYLRNVEEKPPNDAVAAAKDTMIRIMYPKDSENAVVRTTEQYECPFTGKRFGSMDRLVRAAIPHLIKGAINEKRNKAELEAIKKRESGPKYWI